VRGSTRKRGGRWYAYWDLPPKINPETGALERQQKAKGGFPRQKDAEAFLDTVLVSVREATYVEPSKTPLVTFLTGEWLPGIQATVRPLSHARYERIVQTYVVARDIGGVQLCALSPGHFNGLYAELDRDGLSVATRRLTHAVLRRALNDAVKWGKLARNPATAADPPSAERSKVQSWAPSELRRFLAHVEADRLAAIWRLAATTGMRRGELLGLPWRCLDLEAGSLRVEQQLIPTKGGATLGPPKSRRSERTIALDPITVDALRHHRELQLLERDVAGPAYGPDLDLAFADELGRPVHPQRLTEWFARHRKAAGIPVGSLHVLRHTAATIALTNGIPLHVVAARLGDDPKTILATYAHLLPHSDAEAAAVVAEALVDTTLTNPVPALTEIAV
jgi:integrase